MIIDSHSHIGKDNTWNIEGNLDEYVENAIKIGITESILMPTPMPILTIGNSNIIPIMLATYENEYFIVQGIDENNNIRPIPISNNPYKYVNEILYNKIKQYNNENIKLHFIPLINPIYDDLNYLEEIIDKYHPVALKIHGYSSIISPFDIKEDFFRIISKYNIPLIIHTDCDTSSNSPDIEYYYRNLNSPINWINLLQKYSLKGYITHGARLGNKSIETINKDSNLIVGLGPDLLLDNSHDRLYSNDSYLDTLFSKIDINKICFDIDYPWNVNNYNDEILDWNSIDRINDLGLNSNEKEKVLYKNPKSFFKL